MTAAAIAAPLLAGFSFTLFALVVPSLDQQPTTIELPHHRTIFTEGHPFSAAPELAAGLFLLAGLLLVFSVQAAILLRYHNHSPSELAEWYPEYFPEAAGEVAPAAAQALPQWDSPEWHAVQVGSRWYGGFPRRYLAEEIPRANRAAVWMRWLYQLGILALLIGLTAFVWPPPGQCHPGRWALAAVGVLGASIEFGGLWLRPSPAGIAPTGPGDRVPVRADDQAAMALNTPALPTWPQGGAALGVVKAA
jgi:hypothetical protein